MLLCCCAVDDKAPPEVESEERIPATRPFIQTTPAFRPDSIPDVFMVSVTTKSSPLGIVLDVTNPECAVVKEISQGPVRDWNQDCSEDKRVMLLDRILEVNGVRGSSIELAKALGNPDTQEFSITMQRPEERRVQLHRPGEIGIIMNYKKVGAIAPWISKIMPGLLSQWNENMPDQAVCIHDRIVAVNGESGNTEELLAKIRASQETLELTVLHYAI
ncbi:Ccrn4l [Symbiodinium pilosum]|uniref:Ccrn4l protein n=1 Tax=Symbiodinium pilosum TaxID=2952 RepID=A0A812L397_SYMPI|nr:Ccrn4l [Symbiodinium pilosum]